MKFKTFWSILFLRAKLYREHYTVSSIPLIVLCLISRDSYMLFLSQEYDDLIDEFMTAVKQAYGEKTLVQVPNSLATCRQLYVNGICHSLVWTFRIRLQVQRHSIWIMIRTVSFLTCWLYSCIGTIMSLPVWRLCQSQRVPLVSQICTDSSHIQWWYTGTPSIAYSSPQVIVNMFVMLRRSSCLSSILCENVQDGVSLLLVQDRSPARLNCKGYYWEVRCLL